MPVCLDSRLWVIPWHILNYCPRKKAQGGHHSLNAGHRDISTSPQNNSSHSHKSPSAGKLSYLPFGQFIPSCHRWRKNAENKRKNACISPYNSKRIIRSFAPQLLPKLPPGCRASDFWRASFFTRRPSACCYLSPGGAGGKHVAGACLFLTS